MRRGTVPALGLLLVGIGGLPGCGTAGHSGGEVFIPPPCAAQREVVLRSLDRSHLRVDVTGDGKPDTVAVASDAGAAKPCRGLVAVRTHGTVYSAHLIPAAVPVKGFRAGIVGLPRLGRHPGVTLVVDTRAMVDAELAQLFTYSDGRLRAVRVPGRQDGSFIVEGGGVMFPHAARCTASGGFVVSEAAQVQHGRRFQVTRRVYRLDRAGARLSALAAQEASVPSSQLGRRFPEFAGTHWQSCTEQSAH